MIQVAFPMLMSFVAGCSAAAGSGPCGESFCLPAGATILERKSPVEDFVLYRVEWNSAHFLIYEGNAPAIAEGVATTLPLPLDAEATLHTKGGRGSVLMRMQPQWPNFVEVNGPCVSKDECAAAQLAKEVRRR